MPQVHDVLGRLLLSTVSGGLCACERNMQRLQSEFVVLVEFLREL